MESPELGVLIPGMSYEEYASGCLFIGALRSSHLKPLMKSPAHLLAQMSETREETEAFRQGKLIHKLFENPEKFMDSHVIEPEFTGKTKDGRDSTRSAEARQAKASWYASQDPDIIVLTKDDVDMISGIWKSLKTKTLIRNMLSQGTSESSLFVKDPVTGINLACRPDFISKHGHVIDIKSTVDASRDYFVNQIFSFRGYGPFYILQAAHYAHCMRSAKIGTGESFIFVAIEKSPPYEMNVYPMDEGCLAVGEQWREKLTKLYAECVSKNEWPGYEDRAMPVFPPEYATVYEDFE